MKHESMIFFWNIISNENFQKFTPSDCIWRKKGWLRRTPETQSSRDGYIADERSQWSTFVTDIICCRLGAPKRKLKAFPKEKVAFGVLICFKQLPPAPVTPCRPIRNWLWGTKIGNKPCSVSLGSLKSTIQSLRYWAATFCRYSSPDMPSNKACMAGP